MKKETNLDFNLDSEPLNHPAGSHTEWNESYYFVFYSKEQEFGGVTRLGFKPNKKEGMTFFILFLPDGKVAIHQATERIGDSSYPADLRVNGMTHHRNPDGTWHYSFSGNMMLLKNPHDLLKLRAQPSVVLGIQKASMNLTFKPINRVYEYSSHMSAESRELGKKAGDVHWEQIAKVQGDVVLGDSTFKVANVLGQRDHTHGVRDWTGIGSWLYYVVWFSEDLAVNPAAIVAEDGKVSTGGFIFKNGRNIPITRIRVLDQQFSSEIFPVSSKLELLDEEGSTHTLEGKAGPAVPIPFSDEKGQISILTQSFGTFEMDGVSGGYGTFETLRAKHA
ncbi:MAG: hypothetical protein ABSG33_10050 [Candidatus Bathyarchaeia archaeon]|jgi:hypothetical protein